MGFRAFSILRSSRYILIENTINSSYNNSFGSKITNALFLNSKKFFSSIKPDDFEPDYQDELELESLRKTHRENASTAHSTSKTFSDFPLQPKLIQRLNELGYNQPFEIQSETLDHTLSGRNVIGRAITGSGKTLAFAIPIIQKVLEVPKGKRTSPKAILISPTRELCNQIYKTVQELSPNVRCVALYGGASFNRQLWEIERGVDVVCATPGRLNDHLERRTIDLDQLKFLCLDEADELLNPNFKDQIEGVLENSPSDKQTMLFSATMPVDIIDIIRRYMPDPQYVDITSGQAMKVPKSIVHQSVSAPRKLHLPILCCLLEEHQPQRCIIFLRTKDQTKRTSSLLANASLKNIRSSFINSDLSQSRREQVMQGFRKGKFNVLCATDVAARGLDIPEVDLVLQVEPPANGAEFYVHRSGRTGRAGRPGKSIMIHSSTRQEREVIQNIEDVVNLDEIAPPQGVEDMLMKLQDFSLSHLVAYENSNPYPDHSKMKKRPRYNNSNYKRSYQYGSYHSNRNNYGNSDNRYSDNNYSSNRSRRDDEYSNNRYSSNRSRRDEEEWF